MNKELKYKSLKNFTYLLGFPLFVVIVLISLMPMFNKLSMGEHARNWILIILGIWAGVEIIRLLLNKFVAKKSENHRKICLAVVATISILAVLLPTTIFTATTKGNYENARKDLEANVEVMSYDKATGWHNDFTHKNKGGVQLLEMDTIRFMEMYNVKGMETEWYKQANAKDKTIAYGKKIGVYEKLDELSKTKTEAQKRLIKNKPRLEILEKNIKVLDENIIKTENAYQDALKNESKNAEALRITRDLAINTRKSFIKEHQAELVELKGKRVNLAPYKDEIAELVCKMVNDKEVLPDGLPEEIKGIELPLNKILSLVRKIKVVNPETVKYILPDVIYTGIGENTIKSDQKLVKGSSEDLSLQKVEKLNFELQWYPQIFVAGVVKYISYICSGLIILSLLMQYCCDEKLSKLKKEGAKNE